MEKKMNTERVQVTISDGGAGDTALPKETTIVSFHLPDGSVLEVEAFVRNGTNMLQITPRAMTGAPVVVPRTGNMIAVGIADW
jgi:hypothetical protein